LQLKKVIIAHLLDETIFLSFAEEDTKP